MEGTLIRVLDANRTVPVPETFAAGRYQDRVSWNYLIVKYCSGLTLDAVRPDIAREELLSIAAQLGYMTRALHDTPLTPLDGIDTGESWGDLVDRRRREASSELVASGIITSGVADALDPILEDVAAGSMRDSRVVVHGDLESDHVLLERAEGTWKITSIIDFGDAKVGVRDYEWMPLWLGMFDRDIEAMRAFLDAYDRSLLADEEFPRRVMAWTLLHDFGSDAATELIQKIGAPTPVESLGELRQILWPGLTNPAGA